jgi:hypothetical protein
MKNISHALLIALCTCQFLISACKKKNDPVPQSSLCKALIAQEDIVFTGSSPVVAKYVYKYNSNNKLVKIEYNYNGLFTGYDSIIYNANNEIVTLSSYSNNTPSVAQRTMAYTYTNGMITKINEVGVSDSTGPYDVDWDFTYVSGVLYSVIPVMNIGSLPGADTITSIVFVNGNISSVDVKALGGAFTVVSETTAPNPYYGLNNDFDIFKMFNTNNVTSVYPDSSPSTPLESNSYTYLNGRVHTITEEDGTVITITYKCL